MNETITILSGDFKCGRGNYPVWKYTVGSTLYKCVSRATGTCLARSLGIDVHWVASHAGDTFESVILQASVFLLGVKFIFTNIDANNPDDQYSFTVRRENDVHSCKSPWLINFNKLKVVLNDNSFLCLDC